MGAYLRLLPLAVLGVALSWSNPSSGARTVEVPEVTPEAPAIVELPPIVDPGTPAATPEVAYLAQRRF